ncbi:MAG: ATP phosphoribosyltransferase regulatory subunit [Oscillospiraceae bacterium]|nr:ATP phosphoribosyltransferase regulatory subunit [Oscillospiraceae bacterium]
MSNWKLHTPNGVNDILPEECTLKKEIESEIWSVFSSFGYREVETPSFEYYDCYEGLGGQISQETMFKFFDEQGRILTLRPDFTTSIARMASTKATSETSPLRYLYTGSVFRVEQTQGARQREFTQSGIELIGSYSPSADAEVIAAAMEAIMAVGIEEFSMEIGQIAFFNGLMEQTGLEAPEIEKLRERIDSKDSVGIKTITDKLDIDDSIKNLIIELPYLFGGNEVFEKAYAEGLNETSKIALDNLKRIYELLCLYGFEKYVSIDLGMLESIDYYTGTIFKCYTHGVGFPICAGGRYDNLMGQFGSPKGAVGVAIGVNRLLSVLSDRDTQTIGASLVFAEKNAEGIGYDIAYNLRVNGCLVEMYIGGDDYTDAEEYAKSRNISAMLRVFPDGKLIIKDFAREQETETTANEFLGYNDVDECDCGHEHHHDCDCGCEH